MKVRAYTHTDGTVRIVTFAESARKHGETDKAFMDRAYSAMMAADPNIPADFVDIDPGQIPDRNTQDGIPLRPQWRISGQTIVIDPTVRNIFKEYHDKTKEVENIKAKGGALTIADMLDIKKKEIEIELIIKEMNSGR